ncbi:MAG: phosphatidylglycerophosphatase A [Pseudomonadales bacterium]|nr:phosphatidylglycerophosphatase A [Pseudomonadales bacterium]
MTPEMRRRVFTDPRYFVAMGLGSGLAPRAPGTFGTLAAVPFYFALIQLSPVWYLVALILLFAAGVYVCEFVSREMEIKDPGAIVFDEFVGLWLSLFMLPGGWYWLPAGVVLFRVFDILKPFPVSWFDRNVKGGLGIMADDVVAGLYALAAVQLLALGTREFAL